MSHNISFTIVTSNVKWCITIIVSSHWVTVLLIDEVMDYVEVSMMTSFVKWRVTMIVSSHWVTVLFLDKVPYHLQAIVFSSIVEWSVSIIVFTVGVTLILCYQGNDDILPAIVSSQVEQSDQFSMPHHTWY